MGGNGCIKKSRESTAGRGVPGGGFMGGVTRGEGRRKTPPHPNRRQNRWTGVKWSGSGKNNQARGEVPELRSKPGSGGKVSPGGGGLSRWGERAASPHPLVGGQPGGARALAAIPALDAYTAAGDAAASNAAATTTYAPQQPPQQSAMLIDADAPEQARRSKRSESPPHESEEESEWDGEGPPQLPCEVGHPREAQVAYPLRLADIQKKFRDWREYLVVKDTCTKCGAGRTVVKIFFNAGAGKGEDQLWVRRCLWCGFVEEIGPDGKVPKTKAAQTQTGEDDKARRRNTAEQPWGGLAWA